MIRMKRTKPATSGEKGMRTHSVTLHFTNDKKATGAFLKGKVVTNCDDSEGVVRTIPGWELVLDSDGNKLNGNVNNLLEVNSVKMKIGNEYKEVYYLLTKSGSVLCYREDLKAFYVLLANKADARVFPVNGKNGSWLAICTKMGFFLAEPDGSSYKTVFEKNTMAVGAFFKHRVFLGGRGGLVRYSAPEDFENFTLSDDEGGEIAFPNCGGELIAMKPFQDALYLFFERGIVRLKAGGEPSGFYAERLDYTGGDIFPRMICVCQHAVYFLARSGLYRLKGKTTERLDLETQLPTEIAGDEGCAVWKDMPMFRFKVKSLFQVLMITENGKSSVLMQDFKVLGGENNTVLFLNNKSEVCRLAENGTDGIEGKFYTEFIDFGRVDMKRIERLRFYGEGEIYCSIWWEQGFLTKRLSFDSGYAEWKIDRAERGKEFRLQLTLYYKSQIRQVVVDYKTWG